MSIHNFEVFREMNHYDSQDSDRRETTHDEDGPEQLPDLQQEDIFIRFIVNYLFMFGGQDNSCESQGDCDERAHCLQAGTWECKSNHALIMSVIQDNAPLFFYNSCPAVSSLFGCLLPQSSPIPDENAIDMIFILYVTH